jgi:hypothetical protein
MQRTYLLARDHLEQAAAILRGADDHSIQLRSIVERTIAIMMEYEDAQKDTGNVVRFDSYWNPRRTY